MSEAAVYLLAGLVALGASSIALTPRDRRGRKKKPAGSPFEGMDAYAILWNMVLEGRLEEAGKTAKKLLKSYRRQTGPATPPREYLEALEDFSRMVGGGR
jgi:hypothetical protein